MNPPTSRRRSRLAPWFALGTGVFVGQLGDAHAADPTPVSAEACVASFDRAQELRSAGQLLSTREQLAICASPSCPEALTAKCVTWLGEVDAAVPSVLIAAKSGSGEDTLAVRVIEGERVLVEELDGRDLQLDPGEHQLRFEHAGQTEERTVVLRVGERSKLVEVTFAPGASKEPPPGTSPPTSADPAPQPDTGGSVSPMVFVGFGIAGAGLVLGGVTGTIALLQRNDISDQCESSGCTQDDIDAGENIAHVSTAGFALAGVGAILGTVFLFVGGSDEDPTAVGVQPVVGPDWLGLRGTF